MEANLNNRTNLRVVYKRVTDEGEEKHIDAEYIKKRKEVAGMKTDMKKVNEILNNKGKYFKIF